MNRELLVFDIESYKNYFLIGFKRLSDGKKVQIDMAGGDNRFTKEQRRKIRGLLGEYTVFGYNSAKYDVPVMLKAIDGASCKSLFEMGTTIIQNNIPAWKSMQEYDIEPLRELDHFDVSEPSPAVFISLKAYGSRLHSKRLQDLPYPFDTILTKEQMAHVKTYNVNDLDTTIDLYNAIADRIELRVNMSSQYKVDLRSKSDSSDSGDGHCL